ncbi:MAG: ABC transporter substrate-binding protein [Candidatus Methylomirabilia bacterium]
MHDQTTDRRTFLKMTAAMGVGAVSGFAILRPVARAQGSSSRVPTLEVLLPSFPQWVEASRIIAPEWRKLGLDVHLTTRSFQATIPHIQKRPPTYGDVMMMSWGGRDERIDPNFFLEELYHSSRTREKGRNWELYMNPEADKLIDAQKREMDRHKRRQLVWQCQELLAKDYPIWYIAHHNYVNAYNADWEGVTPRMGAGGFFPYSPWTYLNLKSKSGKRKFKLTYRYLIGNFNPFQVFGAVEQAWHRFVYDTFTKLDVNMEVIPWAAESWEMKDYVTFDITLRDGMKWHDGKPVTIEDAKFSFDVVKKAQPAMYQHVVDVVQSTKIVGSNTLRIKLNAPFAPFLVNTLGYMHLVPKHIWEKVDDPLQYANKEMIGSGPFKLGYWRKKEELSLITNKDHFMAPKGIDGFIVLDVPAAETALGMLETGESDAFAWILTPDQISALEGRKDIVVVQSENHAFYEVRGLMTEKPCSDVNFRKALYHAIPKEEIVKVAFGGRATVAKNTPISPKLTFWHNPNLEPVDYSIDKARQILKDAGYTWDSEGRLNYPA